MKVALIYSFKESEWFSCTVINKNLRKAYIELYGEENIIHIDYTRKRFVSYQDIQKIIYECVDKLIFIDHRPTPVNFLERLKKVEGNISKNREYIIHVFGDYPLYLIEWRSVNEMLINKNVKYICASEKQKKYIEKFIIQKEIVFVSPFPVDPVQFNHNPENRELIRKSFGATGDEKVFLYIGRISYQKKIAEMIELFLNSLKDGHIPNNSKFVLIGDYDLLGIQYLGFSQIHGEYFRQIDGVLKKCPEFEKNIIFLGKIENSKLNDYYNAADFYYSLSTYHDEDYGMAVAEAICTGLPALLTNWAGYTSFKTRNAPENCHLVPVSLGRYMPTIDMETAMTYLKEMVNQKFNRKQVADSNGENFYVKPCSKKLASIANTQVPTYIGGTKLMVQITNEQFMKGNEIFRLETNREFNSFYFKVYDVYAE